MSPEPHLVKWGVYHVWCPQARPPKNKWVVAVALSENGQNVFVLPINSKIFELHVGTPSEAAYARLNGEHYSFLYKQESFVCATELWAIGISHFTLKAFTGTRLRPTDRLEVLRAKDASPTMRPAHQALITGTDDWFAD